MSTKFLNFCLVIVISQAALLGCSNSTIELPTPAPTTYQNTIPASLSAAVTTPSQIIKQSSLLTGRIAFINTSKLYESTAIVNMSNGEIKNITGMGVYSLSWSPDYKWLAFDGGLRFSQTDDIFIIQPDGSNLKRITNDSQPKFFVAWSPDGESILYAFRNKDAETNIALVALDNGVTQELTHVNGSESFPTWSPDGKKIAYVYTPNATSTSELWLMESNGNNPRRIVNLPVLYSEIDWSSIEDRIAFISPNNEASDWGKCGDIYIVKPDGSDISRLTNLDGCATAVSWSPDATRIAFIGRNRDGGNIMNLGWQIYVINIYTRNIVQITNEKEWILRFLDWEPILSTN
jgi:dipeptidyl aminopeptidase/acylaminoacyl peptidase